MKRLSTVFVVLAVSCMVIGCRSPIGSIGGKNGPTDVVDGDALIASPKRTSYDIPEKFLREHDLNVFIAYRGVLHTIPLEQVDISVIENLSGDPADYIKFPVLPGEPYPFESKGQKMILVEYNNLSDEYYIEVTDPLDMGGNGDGNDAPGIEVIWAY